MPSTRDRARPDSDLTLFDMFKRPRIQPATLSMIERHVIEAPVADLFRATAEQPAAQAAVDPA